jgi:hypothetical protein
MLITSYEYADKIVSQNNSLAWDGWDILEITHSNNAEFNKSGKIIDGKWAFVNTYPVTEQGWEVPKKYVR